MNQTETVRIELPAAYKYLNILGAAISAMLARVENICDPSATAYNIQLAVQEISANIVEHAYTHAEGRITVTLNLAQQPRRLLIEIADLGDQRFEPRRLVPRAADELEERGWGLFLVEELMDKVEYLPELEGNLWRLEKRL